MDKLLKNSEYKSVKVETVDMMNTFLGIKIPTKGLDEKEAVDVCKAWEEQRIEGRIETRIQTLLEFNKTPEECIKDIEEKYNLSEKEAREYFDKFGTVLA